jgi:hypothetical protein
MKLIRVDMGARPLFRVARVIVVVVVMVNLNDDGIGDGSSHEQVLSLRALRPRTNLSIQDLLIACISSAERSAFAAKRA